MGKKKKIVIGSVAGVTAAAVGVTGFFVWRYTKGGNSADGLAYVCAVSQLNTASASVYDMSFSGVVEPQETKEIKVDTTKTIAEISVQEGDHVKAGDALFSYDVDSMNLELQQGQVEIERMQNENASSQQQITQLETEKKSASKDDQLSYTTQIQSLQTDIAKNEYDIKTKQLELDKLQNTIDNAVVKAEFDGTVQSLKTVEQLQTDGGDVLMKVMSDGEYRVKCVASEQNLAMLSTEEPVLLQSRADDSTWSGTISEIGSEPISSDQNTTVYASNGDEMTTASKYPFYVTLDSSDGLMLGQHLLVTPGGEDTMEKSGIWLYSDYVLTDADGSSYVWAANKKDRLEKRKVELGQSDETMGDMEIVSGLEETDKIAFPSDSYEEGMRTTENQDDLPTEDSEEEGVVTDENGDFLVDDAVQEGDGVEYFEEDAIDAENAEDTVEAEGGAADGT